MGLDVYMRKGPLLSVKFDPEVTTEIKYLGCGNDKCKNHKKELDSRFCPECGNAASEISKNLEFRPEDISENEDLTSVEDNNDNEVFHFYDYDISESMGYLFECHESTFFVNKDSLNDDFEHIDMFKEKYAELLNNLSEKGISYKLEITVYTVASY